MSLLIVREYLILHRYCSKPWHGKVAYCQGLDKGHCMICQMLHDLNSVSLCLQKGSSCDTSGEAGRVCPG